MYIFNIYPGDWVVLCCLVLLFFCLTDQLICNVIQGAHLHPHLRTEIKNLDKVFLIFRPSRDSKTPIVTWILFHM